MGESFTFRNASVALPRLMEYVLGGEEVGSRGGERTLEQRMVQITLTNPREREMFHPLRKANLAAQIAETMWVLAGRNDIKFLSHYLPRAEDFSDDGEKWRGGYGPRLRHWTREPEGSLDQLAFVVNELRGNPLSRRAVMMIYDPALDSGVATKDTPCNNWIHFLSRNGQLDAHVVIRSNDLMWGWSGINAFEWSVVLEIVAAMVGVAVGQLTFSISSLHLYDRHWKRASEISKVQDIKTPIPRGRAFSGSIEDAQYWRRVQPGALDGWLHFWFEIERNLREHPDALENNLKLVETLDNPLFRDWLRVIGYWWSGDERWFLGMSPSLRYAVEKSPGRPSLSSLSVGPVELSPFSRFVSELHAAKHAAYGGSWKKRGELLSILPNIARKVDRLAGGKDTPDESRADTAIDLLVYLIKYRIWLVGEDVLPAISLPVLDPDELKGEVNLVTRYLAFLDGAPVKAGSETGQVPEIVRLFDEYADLIQRKGKSTKGDNVDEYVDTLIGKANIVARVLWQRREDWKKGNEKRSWKGYGE